MNRKRIFRKGVKPSPASPASPSAQDLVPPKKVSRSQSAAHACDGPQSSTPPSRDLNTLLRDHRHRPLDPVILERLRRLLPTICPTICTEFSTSWLARMLSRVDGGPLLDAPRLGPSLRHLGFLPLRRRRGDGRVALWLFPGAARPRRGRPAHQRNATLGSNGDKNGRCGN